MAKRRSSDREYDEQPRGRKSEAEARIERMTWFFMVIAFAILQSQSDLLAANQLNWLIPLSGTAILLGSGMYQYNRHWRVSPITWIGGAVMGALTFVNWYWRPTSNFLFFTLIVFAAVIALGALTNET